MKKSKMMNKNKTKWEGKWSNPMLETKLNKKTNNSNKIFRNNKNIVLMEEKEYTFNNNTSMMLMINKMKIVSPNLNMNKDKKIIKMINKIITNE